MGDRDRIANFGVGRLQQALNAAVPNTSRMPIRDIWQALRDTCGYTNDELVSHAVLLGAEIERPDTRTGFWGIKGSSIQTYNIGVLCWRWLMDNHKFVLEREYDDRVKPDEDSKRESGIEVDRE